MQIKNKINLTFTCFFSLFLFNLNVYAQEFNISALEISVDKKNNIITGTGSVEATDKEGNIIKSDNVTYKQSSEFLTAEGNVQIIDKNGNIVKTDKATFDKPKNLIVAFSNSELLLDNGYKLSTNKILYDSLNKIISSDQNTILTDIDNNIATVTMFQYNVQKYLFSSVGKIKIIDQNGNKYFFKELHVDTNKKEMIGSDVSVVLDQESFGVNKESDPRFVANNIFMSKDISNFSKGVFTTCKKNGDKCPPWLLQAKKISHDKTKKTIYYEHATLKVYNIPIFYFPKFFHPDPTVKRQSGFLTPFFSNSTVSGIGFGLPYYWAISEDKDFTLTPRFYAKENVLLLNEYRQAFRNAFLTLDTSYTSGYKDTSTTKTAGSRNHMFAELDIDLGKDKNYESNLSFKIQKTSNDTYFRVHDIDTALVQSENTNLENKISYNYSKDDMYLNISGTLYEDLRKKTNSKYEYILPNILFGKSFFTEKFGFIDFKSNTIHKNFDTNKHTTFLTNDIIWSPASYITKKGFVNTVEGIIKNTNYKARNTTDYKTEGTINEVSSVIKLKSSLPMKKENAKYSKIFSPNFMLRYAPGHMRSLSGTDVTLNYSNLYSTNKTSVIEDGLSAILGLEYSINEKNENDLERERFSISMGQVFSPDRNNDIPSKSSLDQKMSDLVGEINYNFSEIGSIGYKFSLDHNFNDLNYNQVTSELNFGKISFNLEYLEEQNHIGNENYIKPGFALNFNDSNKLSFSTKKNFKTESTEFYDMKYEYINDCLTAGLLYRREFYQDSDVEPKNSLMFTVTFIPFAGVKSPAF